ncbi:hypothetical protein PQU94_09730 [Asticcacaulis sp. DXS10W]|uniref:Uncharacterized protein n=1 Tax=Asticcacaulis currens TaxID=2984210 RepID=A0ABT5IEH1_9CAUL|nr:hypothetical protein [Asticcacaulis currens]MDC7694559.1 hypothetical protein [Asticcacaulis currens]
MRFTLSQAQSSSSHAVYDRAVAYGLVGITGLSITVWAAVALLIAL